MIANRPWAMRVLTALLGLSALWVAAVPLHAEPQQPGQKPLRMLVLGDKLALEIGRGMEDLFAGKAVIAQTVSLSQGTGALSAADWPLVLPKAIRTGSDVDFVLVMVGAGTPLPGEGEAADEEFLGKVRAQTESRITAIADMLKEADLPYVWVGSPPPSDAALVESTTRTNTAIRERISPLGIYVDIGSGFVDDTKRFVWMGLDIGGRIVRLREVDGGFTQAGARKAAFLTTGELRQPSDATQAVKPYRAISNLVELAKKLDLCQLRQCFTGPVLPLSGLKGVSEEELLTVPPQLDGASVTARVFHEGIVAPARPGRTDDLRWRSTQ